MFGAIWIFRFFQSEAMGGYGAQLVESILQIGAAVGGFAAWLFGVGSET